MENFMPEMIFSPDGAGKENGGRKVAENFNFERDLSGFIAAEYPKHLKIVHERSSVAKDLNRAVADGEIEILKKIESVINARMLYLGEKAKDSEEDMDHMIRLGLLHQEIVKRLDA